MKNKNRIISFVLTFCAMLFGIVQLTVPVNAAPIVSLNPVNTNDSANPLLWIVLFLAAVVVIVFAIIKIKKRK